MGENCGPVGMCTLPTFAGRFARRLAVMSTCLFGCWPSAPCVHDCHLTATRAAPACHMHATLCNFCGVRSPRSTVTRPSDRVHPRPLCNGARLGTSYQSSGMGRCLSKVTPMQSKATTPTLASPLPFTTTAGKPTRRVLWHVSVMCPPHSACI